MLGAHTSAHRNRPRSKASAMNGFTDRTEAGRALAALLIAYARRDDVIVLGLPRGGVPVAYEVAAALHAPLDVIVVRKLGAPGQPELAIGAIASGGISILNQDGAALVAGSPHIRAEIAHENKELKRREALYRNDRLPLSLEGRTVIIVDDGAATGATMRAAMRAARMLAAHRIIAAVPVAPAQSLEILRAEADEVVCILAPAFFGSVSEWYQQFEQTTDTEVSMLLARARAHDHRRLHR